jgi:putative endonuclease
MTVWYAYVLKSLKCDYLYKGHCEDLETRLKQHNSGMTKSIRPYLPFSIAYTETFDTELEAIAREKYFKSAAERRFLKRLLAP